MKNLIEIREMLGIATEEQKEALKQMNQYRKNRR